MWQRRSSNLELYTSGSVPPSLLSPCAAARASGVECQSTCNEVFNQVLWAVREQSHKGLGVLACSAPGKRQLCLLVHIGLRPPSRAARQVPGPLCWSPVPALAFRAKEVTEPTALEKLHPFAFAYVPLQVSTLRSL